MPEPSTRTNPPNPKNRPSDAPLYALLGIVVILLVGALVFLLSQRGVFSAAAPTPTLYVPPTSAEIASVDGTGTAAAVEVIEATVFARLTYTVAPTVTPSITPTSGPTRTPLPTTTSRPSATPRKTFTPRPPATATPRQSSTSVATASTSSEIPAEMLAYFDAVNVLIADIQEGLELIDDAIDEYNKNPDAAFRNEVWLADVADLETHFRGIDSDMRAMTTPADAADIHTAFLRGTQYCLDMAVALNDYATTKIDQRLRDYSGLRSTCASSINGAVLKAKAYIGQFD